MFTIAILCDTTFSGLEFYSFSSTTLPFPENQLAYFSLNPGLLGENVTPTLTNTGSHCLARTHCFLSTCALDLPHAPPQKGSALLTTKTEACNLSSLVRLASQRRKTPLILLPTPKTPPTIPGNPALRFTLPNRTLHRNPSPGYYCD